MQIRRLPDFLYAESDNEIRQGFNVYKRPFCIDCKAFIIAITTHDKINYKPREHSIVLNYSDYEERLTQMVVNVLKKEAN